MSGARPVPRFLNTMTRALEPLPVERGGRVRLYTCGPTVYDYAHIGNFRAFVFEDLLQRFLEAEGYTVDRVMNFTDVDDKTIRNSRAQGKRLADFTAVFKEAFLEDLDRLRIVRPARMPSATEYVGEMIRLIGILVEKGNAYQAEDGSVYFRIASYPAYGRLAHLNLEELRPSGRVNNDEYSKESIGDFALWKAATEEDGENRWDSPWGPGRPGWHIECSAMAMALLGETIEIHCGGADNIFPHHEAEMAQSECVTGRPFVRLWMHCDHLLVNGQKMSKKLGNFYTLRDLAEKGFSGRQVRLALLSVHYRKPLNFVVDELEGQQTALRRVDEWVKRLEKVAGGAAGEPAPWAAAFYAELAEDLNISGALGHLFDAIRDANRALDAGEDAALAASHLAAWRRVDRVLGIGEEGQAGGPPAEVVALAEERSAARARKDWASSDRLRLEIQAKGYAVKDVAGGYELVKLGP